MSRSPAWTSTVGRIRPQRAREEPWPRPATPDQQVSRSAVDAAVPPASATTGIAGGIAYWRYPDRIQPGRAPVVVLHGLGSDHDGLRGFTEALPRDDIIAVDLPGFGQSPPLPGAHTITAYAHALHDLCEQLDLDAVNLVGHSLGADVALAFAGLYPHRVRTLTLLHPVIAGSGLVSWLGRGYYRIATWLPAALARVWLLSRPAVYLSTSVVLSTRDRTRRREILEHDYRTSAFASPRAVCEAYLSLTGTPFAEFARQVAAPTLLSTGGRDGLAAPQTVVALQGYLGNSRVVVIDQAGHLWPVEDPQAAADLVATNLL